jgi:formate hydrogenlyase transcriptional activator
MKPVAITTEKDELDFDNGRKVSRTPAKIRKRSEGISVGINPKTKQQLILEIEGLRKKLEAAERDLQDLTHPKSKEALKISELGSRRLFEMTQDGILIFGAESGPGQALSETKELKDQLEADRGYFRQEAIKRHGMDHILGQSDGLKYVLFRAEQVAPQDTTVLILGETGTGKELIAAAIHNLSPRQGRQLITVNCAALPANLIESELFGREKGAFTGADVRRMGRFEIEIGRAHV